MMLAVNSYTISYYIDQFNINLKLNTLYWKCWFSPVNYNSVKYTSYKNSHPVAVNAMIYYS